MADRDWSGLPIDILELIARRLYYIEDLFTFRRVCHSWQLATLRKSLFQPVLSKGVPWLMLTEREIGDDTRGAFSLSTNKIHNIYLPEARGRRCWGTPYGWLITVDGKGEFHLLNPLTRKQMQLPPNSTFEYNYPIFDEEEEGDFVQRVFQKVVLGLIPPSSSSSSSSTFEDQFVVFVSYHVIRLAFARPGDKAWTTIEIPPRQGHVSDMIVFNSQIYGVVNGRPFICDINRPQPNFKFIASKTPHAAASDDYYLVEIAGELHIVVREFLGDRHLFTAYLPKGCNVVTVQDHFVVYKLDLGTEKYSKLESFEDHALFVGINSSFSISIDDHPEFNGNSIYFTDDVHLGDYHDVGRDMGVFDYKEKVVRPFYLGPDVLSSQYCPPTMLTPNLW